MATQTQQKLVPPVVAAKPTPDKNANKPIVENGSPKQKVEKESPKQKTEPESPKQKAEIDTPKQKVEKDPPKQRAHADSPKPTVEKDPVKAKDETDANKPKPAKEESKETIVKTDAPKKATGQSAAGIAFGPNGELYIFDDDREAVKRYKWEKSSMKGPDTFKLSRKDKNDNVKQEAVPQDVAYLKSDEFDGLVITMDNGNLYTMSGKDLSKKNTLNMATKFSDISDLRAAKEDKSLLNKIRKKFPLMAVDTAKSLLTLLNTEGVADAKLTLDKSIGVANARFAHAEDKDLVIVTGKGGLYCFVLYKGDGDKLELKISAHIPSDEKFQPGGICVSGDNIYVCNPVANRLVKLDIEEEGDKLMMNLEMKIPFNDPQSVDVYTDDKMVNLCVVNARGDIDLMTLWKD